jgi:hypothetical protein
VRGVAPFEGSNTESDSLRSKGGMLHTSTAPLPMRYTTMGYTSMIYTSIALYLYKQFTQAPNKIYLKHFTGNVVEYEGWGCCISFDSSSFKGLSRCYEKCWKSAAILLFAKIMYTLLHRENFGHISNALRIL